MTPMKDFNLNDFDFEQALKEIGDLKKEFLYKNKASSISPFSGRWTREGDTVVFTDLSDRQVYHRNTLEFALKTVRENREGYATEKDWREHIAHFEHGRSLLV